MKIKKIVWPKEPRIYVENFKEIPNFIANLPTGQFAIIEENPDGVWRWGIVSGTCRGIEPLKQLAEAACQEAWENMIKDCIEENFNE